MNNTEKYDKQLLRAKLQTQVARWRLAMGTLGEVTKAMQDRDSVAVGTALSRLGEEIEAGEKFAQQILHELDDAGHYAEVAS